MKKIFLFILICFIMPFLLGAGKYVVVHNYFYHKHMSQKAHTYIPMLNYLYAVNPSDGLYAADTNFRITDYNVAAHLFNDGSKYMDFTDNFKEPYKYNIVKRNIHLVRKLNDTTAWIGTTKGGFYVFHDMPYPRLDTLKCIAHYYSKNVEGFGFQNGFPSVFFPSDTGAANCVSNFAFDKNKEYVYYLAYGYTIGKMRIDNPTAVEWQADVLPKEIHPWPLFQSLFELTDDGYIWLYARYDLDNENVRLLRFNINNKEYKLFDTTDFGFCGGIGGQTYIDHRGDISHRIAVLPKHNIVVIPTSRLYIQDHYADSVLNRIAIYENDKWDTLAIPHNFLDTIIDGKLEKGYVLSDILRWSDDEFIFNFLWYSKKLEYHAKHLIYNVVTKEWRNGYPAPQRRKTWADMLGLHSTFIWRGKRYIEHSNRILCVYEPDGEGDIGETKENIILPDVWIRSISPNPASLRATVNIMYYPRGGVYKSGDLDVGLYDVLGQKILDLTDLGTYSDFSKTFEVSFDIPSTISSGVYLINVSNGNETRTKCLSITRLSQK